MSQPYEEAKTALEALKATYGARYANYVAGTTKYCDNMSRKLDELERLFGLLCPSFPGPVTLYLTSFAIGSGFHQVVKLGKARWSGTKNSAITTDYAEEHDRSLRYGAGLGLSAPVVGGNRRCLAKQQITRMSRIRVLARRGGTIF